MDKLTLPVPGAGGPVAYDHQTLLFTRVKAGVFQLALGTAKQRKDWIDRSKKIDAHFKMPREWGVF
jgi:hypothetical protein